MLAEPEIVDVWGLNDPSYRKTDWKRWGAKTPPLPMGFAVGGAAQIPKIYDFRPDQPPGRMISFGALIQWAVKCPSADHFASRFGSWVHSGGLAGLAKTREVPPLQRDAEVVFWFFGGHTFSRCEWFVGLAAFGGKAPKDIIF